MSLGLHFIDVLLQRFWKSRYAISGNDEAWTVSMLRQIVDLLVDSIHVVEKSETSHRLELLALLLDCRNESLELLDLCIRDWQGACLLQDPCRQFQTSCNSSPIISSLNGIVQSLDSQSVSLGEVMKLCCHGSCQSWGSRTPRRGRHLKKKIYQTSKLISQVLTPNSTGIIEDHHSERFDSKNTVLIHMEYYLYLIYYWYEGNLSNKLPSVSWLLIHSFPSTQEGHWLLKPKCYLPLAEQPVVSWINECVSPIWSKLIILRSLGTFWRPRTACCSTVSCLMSVQRTLESELAASKTISLPHQGGYKPLNWQVYDSPRFLIFSPSLCQIKQHPRNKFREKIPISPKGLPKYTQTRLHPTKPKGWQSYTISMSILLQVLQPFRGWQENV